MAPIDFLNAEKMTAVLEDRHSVQYWDVITQSACMGTSVVCLAMRLYSRVFLSRSPGCEDCMSVLFYFSPWC